MSDPRRGIPRTDDLLALPEVAATVPRLGRPLVLATARSVGAQARAGDLDPDAVVPALVQTLHRLLLGTAEVVNATGIVVHTGLGRAPLTEAARRAMARAGAPTPVELDLDTGRRGRRGATALAALAAALPTAEDVLVVNNGAAALLLAALVAADGAPMVVSRGELVEIGDGFRLPELLAAGGVSLVEVGTTNRTHLTDYRAALEAGAGAVLKVHRSNFTLAGFTGEVGIPALAGLGAPVVHDLGSGLLEPHPLLPDEPDAAGSLAAGATLVTFSTDKLLGGPQGGVIAGRADLVQACRRHPLARAVRVDKTTLAGLAATLAEPDPTVLRGVETDPARLRERTESMAARVPGSQVVPADGFIGGGGAPMQPLPGWALAVPEAWAVALRLGTPPVLARVEHGRALIDLRCVPPPRDALLAGVLRELAEEPPTLRS